MGETQVKTEEKLKGRKTRRSHKTEEEEIKPENDLKEHISIVEECKNQQKKETFEKESPVTERRTRRSNGKIDEVKGTPDKEINSEPISKKEETKQEQELKVGNLKSEKSNEQQVVDS